MRRLTGREIFKENCPLIILALVCFLLAVGVPILYFSAPELKYEDLQSREITVESLEWIEATEAEDYYIVTTESGERFRISGQYDRDRLEELLTAGTRAGIRYYENSFLWQSRKFAEVIYVDRECVVEFEQEKSSPWAVMGVSVFLFLFALAIVALLRWEIMRRKKLQEMRDKRIARKYGSANNKQTVWKKEQNERNL